MSLTIDAGVARTLRELADRDELTRLVSRLGRWLDAGAPHDEAPAILAADVAVATPGGRAQGIDAVVAQAARMHDVPTQHLVTNALIELDGDRARIGANLLVAFVRDAAAPELMGERYAFEAVRTPAGWRVARVGVTPLWRRA